MGSVCRSTTSWQFWAASETSWCIARRSGSGIWGPSMARKLEALRTWPPVSWPLLTRTALSAGSDP
ncbi:hypothetical protein ABZ626_35955 [Streptomyces longispororuber]|uniref:hypothetical protein n=1 Tax=Streptomyces longispororuber TaxID=68230 RepID=UPI0033F80B84